MSAAQQKAQANFKKAIAYRSKTGCSLKEAFAHVKGNKVTGLDKVVKKGNKTSVLYTKTAKKKAAPKKKAAKKRIVKKKAAKKSTVNGWKKSQTYFREKDEGKVKGKKNYVVSRVPKGSLFGGGTFTNFKKISGYNTQPEIIVGRIGNIKKIENLIPAIKVRVTRGKSVDTESIQSSSTSVKVFKKYIGKNLIQTQEHFSIMFLNNANKCIGVYMMSSGGYTAVVADVRIILGAALRLASTGIILCHNHPSGNLQPSQADITFTQKIKIAAQQMDIRVIDHIIVTDNGYYSFMENGDL